MNNKEVIIFKTIDDMADFVVKQWEVISREAIKERGQFTAALSGGRTPLVLYKKLSGEIKLPWDKTHIFMADERFVPYESGENNYHSISRILLRHVGIPGKNIHPVFTSEDSARASAKRYEGDLISFFRITGKKLPRFDLMLLGIGEDGHTASLFPDTSALQESKRLAAAVSPRDESIKERITLTLPVINNAANIMFMAAGRNKANIAREVIEGKNSLLPAALVKPGHGRLFFLLDEDAGALLGN